MSTELPKTYDPSTVEPETYRVWTEEGLFTADPSKPGESYSIVIPPPNVTGALHLGHAINNTLQDILTRNHRMRGFNTLWVPGIDHAGIATQAVVEKQLKEKEGKTRHDVGRQCLVERIWAWKQQYGDRILEQLKRLGASCDWTRTRFTLDEMCARAVRETFFKLFKDGLIYRGKRLVNWDIYLQTSISDDEIYHETVKTSLWHIRYPIVDGPNEKARLSAQGTEPSGSAAGSSGASAPTKRSNGKNRVIDGPIPEPIDRQMHRTIKKVGADIAGLRFNTAIAELIKLNNEMSKLPGVPRELAENFTLMLSPFAPHIAEEIWERLGHHKSLSRRPWPTADEAKLVEDSLELPVQVNGKLRGKVTVPADADDSAILSAARSAEHVKPWVEGKTVVKELYVPKKLVNFVVK